MVRATLDPGAHASVTWRVSEADLANAIGVGMSDISPECWPRTTNPAHKSVDAWVLFASNVQSLTLAQSFFNALPAETARWKRTVPRFAPINALIAMDFYLHILQLLNLVVKTYKEDKL